MSSLPAATLIASDDVAAALIASLGSDDAAAAAATLASVYSLAQVEDNQVVLRPVVPAALAACKRHFGDAAVMECGLRCLGQLSRDPPARAALFEGGVVDVLVAAQGTFVDKVGVQVVALSLLANLATMGNQEACAPLIDGTLAAMARFGTVEVAFEACFALANLANSAPVARLLATAGGFFAVLGAMRAWPDKQAVALHGCRFVSNMCLYSLERRREARLVDAIPAVTHAGRQFRDDPEVLSEVCAALGCLMRNVADNRDAVINAGGLEIILDAISRFPEHGGLLHDAGFAVGDLVAHSTLHCDMVHDVGGLQVLLGANARSGLGQARVFGAMCRAIGYLAHSERNRQAVAADAKAVQLLVGGIKTHATAVAAMEEALFALGKLTERSPPAARALFDAGAVPAVVSVMSAHAGGADIQKEGCFALASFAAYRSKRPAVQLCGIPVVLRALTRFAEDRRVMEEVMAALSPLAAGGGGSGSGALVGALPKVMDAVRRFPDNPEISYGGLSAVAQLLAFHPHTRADLQAELPFVRLLVAAGASPEAELAAMHVLWLLLQCSWTAAKAVGMEAELRYWRTDFLLGCLEFDDLPEVQSVVPAGDHPVRGFDHNVSLYEVAGMLGAPRCQQWLFETGKYRGLLNQLTDGASMGFEFCVRDWWLTFLLWVAHGGDINLAGDPTAQRGLKTPADAAKASPLPAMKFVGEALAGGDFRLVAWATGRAFSGVPSFWELAERHPVRRVSIAWMDPMRKVHESWPMERLQAFQVLEAAWTRFGGGAPPPEWSPVSRMLCLRRLCRLRGASEVDMAMELVEPFGREVCLFL